MSGFKRFFETNFKYQELFETSFEKLYAKNYFGNIDKEEAKSRLTDWYIKFVVMVEQKVEEELVFALCTTTGKECRLWFEALTGYNVKNETNKVIKEVVAKYCRG